jgi:hypothetical protein
MQTRLALRMWCYENGLTSGLYYKHTMIVNYAYSIINKLEALLTDDARVIIYDRHVFIEQATGEIPRINKLKKVDFE